MIYPEFSWYLISSYQMIRSTNFNNTWEVVQNEETGSLVFNKQIAGPFYTLTSIRSSHEFVPFFEQLYMLRLFTYLSVSWKNVIPLSLYNFFPFFKCIGRLSPYVYKSTHEMYTQKSARTYGMTNRYWMLVVIVARYSTVWLAILIRYKDSL